MLRSFHYRDFPRRPAGRRQAGPAVSVCLPARNEAATVGATVETIQRELMDDHAVVDELVVIDDGSTDDTAAVAAAAGATVVAAAEVLPEYGTEHGKGQAMWRARARHLRRRGGVLRRRHTAASTPGSCSACSARSSRGTTSPSSRASTSARSTAGPAKAAG